MEHEGELCSSGDRDLQQEGDVVLKTRAVSSARGWERRGTAKGQARAGG